MTYLTDEFSMDMLPLECATCIKNKVVPLEELGKIEFRSCIQSMYVAMVLTVLLDKDISQNPVELKLEPDDVLYIVEVDDATEIRVIKMEFSN